MPAGAKKKDIDFDRVEQMAIAGSNGVQIAAAIGVHPDTLYKAIAEKFKTDFSAWLQTKREKGNDLLLRKQFDLAMNGDRAMLIWLGKQRLGQQEKTFIETTEIPKIVIIPDAESTE